jgi:hypothetical protein
MWRVFSASATGKRNLEQGVPGQDACHCMTAGDGLVAIVCDGAGSVREGQAGAEFVSHTLAEQLSQALRADPDIPAYDAARAAIDAVRARLALIAQSRELALQEFSCTLVGCVSAARGSCFFHIGDGFAIWRDAAGNCVMSQPENGEYADETYFVTDENWREHLRVTPLPAPGPGGLIGLLSDGAAPFAVNRARDGFFAPFIDPVAAFLSRAAPADGDAALRNLLESPRASEISADDKTLLLAFVA